ncbi:MAG: hypothetical protein H0U76_05055 [Ktedonobacteraceae bacterium]|nr:hypothetical protein [Ktedonobacteraceae bacterium]
MTVSHLARAIENVGIPTVSVYIEAFRPTAELLKPPRALFTPFMMGRPLGLPHQRELQLATIQLALNLLASADNSPTFENFIQ